MEPESFPAFFTRTVCFLLVALAGVLSVAPEHTVKVNRQAVPGHQELAPQPSRELAPVPTTHLGQAAPVPTTHLGHATPQPTTHLGQAAPAPTTHLGQATPALGQPAFHPGPLPDIQMAVQPGVGQLFPDSTPVTPRPLRDQVMDTQDVIPDSFPLPDDAKEWAKELANQAYLRFLKEQPAKALQLETAGTEPEEWFAKELRAKVSGMSPSAVRPMWRTELGRIRRNVSASAQACASPSTSYFDYTNLSAAVPKTWQCFLDTVEADSFSFSSIESDPVKSD
ncbi:hypothetical protein PAPYR_11515 [Paratrimastix pyriformis]|uniref:Uncharacterized protein n=1 Tax=Paratrimastix pyriformis TaxID=342808 RepID=A0ABQ8U3L4_9EUKA|nr:hypothetical protein PAPYR_11515 [Paratrimastix pyriformis]